MKFFERFRVVQKTTAAIQKRKNRALQELEGSVHPLFWMVPIYLEIFYTGICIDPNTREEMRAMSKSDEESLDKINCMLAFSFIWEMGRLWGQQFFALPQVRLGMNNIWSTDEESLNLLVGKFDATPLEEQALIVWEYIQWALNDTSLNPIFGMVHLGGALTKTLKQFEGLRGSVPAS